MASDSLKRWRLYGKPKARRNTGREGKKNELSEEDLKKVNGGAVDILLKLDGIDGESQDDKHKGEIE